MFVHGSLHFEYQDNTILAVIREVMLQARTSMEYTANFKGAVIF